MGFSAGCKAFTGVWSFPHRKQVREWALGNRSSGALLWSSSARRGTGLLAVLLGPRDRMCALDRLAETIVVDVRRGSQPHSKQTYSKQVKARNQFEAARCIRYPHQRLVTPVTLSRTRLHSKI
jgi:hypothetical protein